MEKVIPVEPWILTVADRSPDVVKVRLEAPMAPAVRVPTAEVVKDSWLLAVRLVWLPITAVGEKVIWDAPRRAPEAPRMPTGEKVRVEVP